MKKEADKAGADELREEYDFSRGVRGKYAQRYSEGTNIIILDADVAKVFRDSEVTIQPGEMIRGREGSWGGLQRRSSGPQ